MIKRLKKYPDKILLGIVAVNIISTVLHYTDNVCFFSDYPEPTWLNAHIVDSIWFIMTPFAIAGLLLYGNGKRKSAFVSLGIYSLMSLLVLGHYLFAPFDGISLRIHLFIWMEAIAASVLLFYLIKTRSVIS